MRLEIKKPIHFFESALHVFLPQQKTLPKWENGLFVKNSKLIELNQTIQMGAN
jgi:hypothetical protein